MVTPRESASVEDRNKLAAHCIWAGDSRAGKFFNFNVTLYHLLSRTCEASSLRKSLVKIKEAEVLLVKHNVVQFYVERHKTLNMPQYMSVYPHRDNIFEDMYFSFAYHLIMTDDADNDHFFPDFATKISNEASNKLDTETAKMFRTYFDSLVKISEKYDGLANDEDDEYGEFVCVLPSKLASGHIGKKSGINQLADLENMQMFVFREGWMVKNMHTAFDYIFNIQKKTQFVGRF